MSLFHRHDWSDWSITERGKVVDKVYQHDVIGAYLIQDRFCHTCGKHKIEQQRTGSPLSNVRLVAEVRPAMRQPQKDRTS